ncbi:MAG: type II secretion system protein [Planctomycetota bacterium]
MRRSAFTLVELMIIIGVLAILAAIVLPSLSNASSKAQAATIATNMRALADACRVAHEQTGNWPAYDSDEDGPGMPAILDGLMSEHAWYDIADSWGGGEVMLFQNSTGLHYTITGNGDLNETLEELERLVDDGSATTGVLTWQTNSTGFYVDWTLD